MTLISFGVNHKTAAIDLRERLAFSNSTMPAALHSLQAHSGVREAVLLSTCNRTEIYAVIDQAVIATENFSNWLASQHQLQLDELSTCCYYHYDLDAVKHMMRVASGLDSMVLGESEILGQMKRAYETAGQCGLVGSQLQFLFQIIFSTSKQVRTETNIGANAVTFAYAGLQIADRIFAADKNCRILMIGSGEMIELTARYFASRKNSSFIFAARTLDKAQALVEQFNGQAIHMGDIAQQLKEVDIIVTATASQLPILGKGALESAFKARKHQPLLILDLAVPRDVEAEIAELADVYLYNIDDLQSIVAQNKQSRQEAAQQAEKIIQLQAEHYLHQLQVHNAKAIINGYRENLTELRDAELALALKALQQGKDPQMVLTQFANTLTNKIMHHPTIQIRQAAYNGELEKLKLIKEIFSPALQSANEVE